MQAMIYDGKFVNFWGNDLSDNFLTATIEKMSWDKTKLKVFSFDSHKQDIANAMTNSNSLKMVCNVSGKLDISEISVSKKSVKKTIFPWEEGAKGLFTEEEIEQASINHYFLIDNPEATTEELPFPSAVMTAKEKWVLEDVETLTPVISYQGVDVDIDAKLAQEASVT